jgi:hypothetical protein
LPELTENISAAHEGKPYKKLAIFSGHDTSLQPVLSAMQVSIGEYPGYASYVHYLLTKVILELYKDKKKTGEGYVRLLYKGTPMQVPACSPTGAHHPSSPTLCTYEAFMGRVREMSISEKEYAKLCEAAVILPDWD